MYTALVARYGCQTSRKRVSINTYIATIILRPRHIIVNIFKHVSDSVRLLVAE